MPMQMDGREAQFFKLTIHRLAILSQLRYSEFKVYSYLAALDPFGNTQQSLDMDDLLSVCNIKLPTAYKALASLHESGLIQWLHVKSNVHVKPIYSDGSFSTPVESVLPQENAVSSSRMRSTPVEKRLRKSPRSAAFKGQRSGDLRSGHLNKKSGDLVTDEEYLQWIASGIDALPRPPKGHYRQQHIEAAADDPSNQERFSKLKSKQKAIAVDEAPFPTFYTGNEKDEALRQQRIDRLNALLREGKIEKVEDFICDHPEWGLTLNATRSEVLAR